MNEVDRAIAALAEQQFGVFSRAQAVAGLSERAMTLPGDDAVVGADVPVCIPIAGAPVPDGNARWRRCCGRATRGDLAHHCGPACSGSTRFGAASST